MAKFQDGKAGHARALRRGPYEAALAQTPAEMRQAQALRQQVFRGQTEGYDQDRFDDNAQHMLLRHRESGALLGGFRLHLHSGPKVLDGYSAQFYDLRAFEALPQPLLELGRFCLHPQARDPDLLRLAWGAITAIIDQEGVGLMFGCTSFIGADPAQHAGGLAALIPRIGPQALRPMRKPGQGIALQDFCYHPPQPAQLPPLLRSYLGLGAWVSDHAVLDYGLDTLHVLTCVEIAAIPPLRARSLRGIVAESLG